MRLLVMNGGLWAAFRIAATTGSGGAPSSGAVARVLSPSSAFAPRLAGTVNSSTTSVRSSPSSSSSTSSWTARERSTGSPAFTRYSPLIFSTPGPSGRGARPPLRWFRGRDGRRSPLRSCLRSAFGLGFQDGLHHAADVGRAADVVDPHDPAAPGDTDRQRGEGDLTAVVDAETEQVAEIALVAGREQQRVPEVGEHPALPEQDAAHDRRLAEVEAGVDRD